jgi:hypothetical protein
MCTGCMAGRTGSHTDSSGLEAGRPVGVPGGHQRPTGKFHRSTGLQTGSSDLGVGSTDLLIGARAEYLPNDYFFT